MPLFRLLVLSLLVAALIFLIRSVRNRLTHRPNKSNDPRPSLGQDMVACDRCGLHIPKAEAVVKESRYYCCQEHSE